MIEDYSNVLQNIQNELKEYCVSNSLKSLVIGVSGGIDSAVVCALAKPVCDEIGIPLIGRYIGITSNSPEEKERAIAIGESYCHDFKCVTLGKEFMFLLEAMEGDNKNAIANGNIKARMRMIYLYDVAGRTGGMVLGTDNWTEYLLGFWTKNGDDFDYNLIHSLWKSEVYSLADHFVFVNSILRSMDATNRANAMKACVDANATDGLGISETDLDQIMPDWKERHKNTREGYTEVDFVLQKYTALTHEGIFDELNDNPVIKRHLRTNFKRNIPINVPRSKIV
jgi:NAD+ synthase